MDRYLISELLIILSIVITLGAQIFINTTYNKNSKIKNKKGITGKSVARKILDRHDLEDIEIYETRGNLTDHYDPTKKIINLSEGIYNKDSIVALAVSAHECGHAIQDKEGYTFMRIRASLVKTVNFSSYAGYIAITIGLLFSMIKLIWIGIILEGVILLFQIVTLPVEINASKRALKEIKELDLLEKQEYSKAKITLIAAALTYVASVASTLIQILRLILIVANRNDRR